MQPHIRPKPYRRKYPLPRGGNAAHRATAGAVLEFGRFRVLLRRRQLLADGVPVDVGTRAFNILLVLLGADGLLVTKEDLLSRVWLGIVVCEDSPGAKIRQAPLPKFSDAAGRRKPSATDRSALSCKGEET
jgi:hypothetical protein